MLEYFTKSKIIYWINDPIVWVFEVIGMGLLGFNILLILYIILKFRKYNIIDIMVFTLYVASWCWLLTGCLEFITIPIFKLIIRDNQGVVLFEDFQLTLYGLGQLIGIVIYTVCGGRWKIQKRG